VFLATIGAALLTAAVGVFLGNVARVCAHLWSPARKAVRAT